MVDWDQPLTRVLVLKSGAELRTLGDVAEPLEYAIQLMLQAARTGEGRSAVSKHAGTLTEAVQGTLARRGGSA